MFFACLFTLLQLARGGSFACCQRTFSAACVRWQRSSVLFPLRQTTSAAATFLLSDLSPPDLVASEKNMMTRADASPAAPPAAGTLLSVFKILTDPRCFPVTILFFCWVGRANGPRNPFSALGPQPNSRARRLGESDSSYGWWNRTE
jgi:hypothetical protein